MVDVITIFGVTIMAIKCRVVHSETRRLSFYTAGPLTLFSLGLFWQQNTVTTGDTRVTIITQPFSKARMPFISYDDFTLEKG